MCFLVPPRELSKKSRATGGNFRRTEPAARPLSRILIMVNNLPRWQYICPCAMSGYLCPCLPLRGVVGVVTKIPVGRGRKRRVLPHCNAFHFNSGRNCPLPLCMQLLSGRGRRRPAGPMHPTIQRPRDALLRAEPARVSARQWVYVDRASERERASEDDVKSGL